MQPKSATLTIEGHDAVELPIYHPAMGNDVIDIGKLGDHEFFDRGGHRDEN